METDPYYPLEPSSRMRLADLVRVVNIAGAVMYGMDDVLVGHDRLTLVLLVAENTHADHCCRACVARTWQTVVHRLQSRQYLRNLHLLPNNRIHTAINTTTGLVDLRMPRRSRRPRRKRPNNFTPTPRRIRHTCTALTTHITHSCRLGVHGEQAICGCDGPD